MPGEHAHIARLEVTLEVVAGRACRCATSAWRPSPGNGQSERATEPWRAALVSRQRRAAPLVGAVEQPDAGKAEHGRDRLDVSDVGRVRAREERSRAMRSSNGSSRTATGRLPRRGSHRAALLRPWRARAPVLRSEPPSRTSITEMVGNCAVMESMARLAPASSMRARPPLVPHRRGPLADKVVAAGDPRGRDVARRARNATRPGELDAELGRRMDLRRHPLRPTTAPPSREQRHSKSGPAEPRCHGSSS